MKKIFFLCALCASVLAANATEGALSGKFTINANGDQIVFSQGNLQATTTDLGANWTWSFATNQWDYIGNAAANTAITGNGTVSSNGTMDLFGWSTATTYYGINNSMNESDYSGNFKDWGDNSITNGGNEGGIWRTLSMDEWRYLIYRRTDAAKLFGMGTVNGVNGTILLPDNWAGTKFSDTENGLTDKGTYYYNSNGTNYTFHSYAGQAWEDMEKAGAVFLPAAGYRNGTDVSSAGSDGYYWSATQDGTKYAYDLGFYSYDLGPQNYNNRSDGFSVRLVQAAPKPLPQTKEMTPTWGDLSWDELHQQWRLASYELDASDNPLFYFGVGVDGVKETMPTSFVLSNSTDDQFIFVDVEHMEDFGGVVKDAAITITADGSGYHYDAVDAKYYLLAKFSGEMNDADGNKLIVKEPTNFIKLFVPTDVATAIDEISNDKMRKCENAKIILGGQLLIFRDGVMYNAQGARVE